MNDRFKFRAWRYGGFVNPDNFCLGFNGDKVVEFSWEIEHDDIEDYILMQCTGLKDKNGVLIYEGDILLHNHKYGEYLQSPVEWSDSIEDQEGVLYAGFTVDSRCVKDAMVVGNIYENPELLNK